MSAADVAVRIPALLGVLTALAFLVWLLYASFSSPRHIDRDEARFLLGILVALAVVASLVWGLTNGGEVW